VSRAPRQVGAQLCVLLAVLLAIACGTASTPQSPAVGTSSPSASSTAELATPEPSPSDDLATVATVEENGILVTIRLDRNPMPAGEETWLTTEVRNTGEDDLVWLHGGCAITVGVGGTMQEARWRPGARQEGVSGEFKRMTISRQNLGEGTVQISFVPQRFIGRGRYGCGDVGITETILPGETIRQRAQWDGQAHLRLGLPPSGRVELHAVACCCWRERDGEPQDIPEEGSIRLSHQAWIADGRDRSLLDPPEIIDAALAEPAFVDWLATKDLGSGHDPVLWFDAEAELWEVGLLEYDVRRFHVALVHPRTGEVVEIIERPWDPDVDGYP
jgi:hypothetical protein